MADNDDLMIEVTGSSDKAANAIDRVINKVTKMQDAVEKMVPSLTKFTERMDSLASSSKAFAALDRLTKSTGNVAAASKKAEANEAMYQARLDRANVSMDKSRLQAEKLSNAFKKVSEAEAIAAHNNAAFSMPTKEFAQKYNTSTGNEGINLTPEVPTDTYEPTPAPGHTKLASEMGTPHKVSFNFSTGNVQSEIGKIQNFIDGLIPHVSHMSSSAQAQFNELAEKIKLVSQQIDNQRGLYHNLASAASQAAKESGEGSNSYLRIEKRMLSADSAMDRLLNKQEKLKAEMSSVASSAEKAGWGFSRLGSKGEKSASKTKSAWSSTMRMMRKMFIRIAAFRIFSALSQGIATGIQDMALASNRANSAMSALSTNALYLKNSVGAALMPVLQSLVPVLNQITDALANVFNTIAALNARIFNHSSTVTIAKRANVDYAATLNKSGNGASNANKKIKELQRTVMGFDELNKLSKETESLTPKSKSGSGSGSAGMPSYGSMFKTVKVPGWVNKIGGVTDIISNWWKGLTDAQKWGAGIGGTAGTIIGGIIGHLICPGIGTVLGAALGGVVGTVIGAWWAGLTTKEKWASGIGAGAGAVIGGIIGHMIGGKVGTIVGSTLGALVGGIAGKWWADLTTPEKWSAGIGAGAGATLGGIIGGILTKGNPIGIAVGIALGTTIGAIIGKWWSGLTTKQKWASGAGAVSGSVIGGIIGGLIAGPIGVVVGVALGGTAGTIIAKWWSTLSSKQKWSVGSIGVGAVAGAIIGTIFLGPLGTILGAGIGGLAGKLIEKFWDYLSNKGHWKVGKAEGIAATIGAIIGGIIGGPLGAAIGAAIAAGTTFAVDKFVNKHAKGTTYHIGGPALVNDAPGSVYREMVQLPNGKTFIPKRRNVLIPNLPIGSKVIEANKTKNMLSHYSDGIGKLDLGKLITSMDISSVETSPQINFQTNQRANLQVSNNSNGSNFDLRQISDDIKALKKSIDDLKFDFYADDCKVARAANRGNHILDRTSAIAHT